ncbi:hypothetical protein [Arthrobacter sp. GMC3]|uniref:hypothetical protein n=1 Tax=Arthrobacter sp. GMC3 TaxID=2058894 RepID=UPI000CE38641|nr:hypothetical protein [Arthrobacter sp. GMC3]
MDEKWASNCLKDTGQLLGEFFPHDPTGLNKAAEEVCLAALEDATLGGVLSCIGMTFAIASLILGLFRLRDFDRVVKIGSWVLVIAGLLVAGLGVLLIGTWYFALSFGGGLVLALVFVILILNASKAPAH